MRWEHSLRYTTPCLRSDIVKEGPRNVVLTRRARLHNDQPTSATRQSILLSVRLHHRLSRLSSRHNTARVMALIEVCFDVHPPECSDHSFRSSLMIAWDAKVSRLSLISHFTDALSIQYVSNAARTILWATSRSSSPHKPGRIGARSNSRNGAYPSTSLAIVLKTKI